MKQNLTQNNWQLNASENRVKWAEENCFWHTAALEKYQEAIIKSPISAMWEGTRIAGRTPKTCGKHSNTEIETRSQCSPQRFTGSFTHSCRGYLHSPSLNRDTARASWYRENGGGWKCVCICAWDYKSLEDSEINLCNCQDSVSVPVPAQSLREWPTQVDPFSGAAA